MSFNKDLQELLNSTLQGAKLRGETETATKLTRAIKTRVWQNLVNKKLSTL